MMVNPTFFLCFKKQNFVEDENIFHVTRYVILVRGSVCLMVYKNNKATSCHKMEGVGPSNIR